MNQKIKSFFLNHKVIISIWILIASISALKQYFVENWQYKINNYLIFKNVFYNTIHERNLYAEYPDLYFDHNHYGPIFSIFIAPFALLPDGFGIVLWSIFNAALLVFAIQKIPLVTNKKTLILWICLNEFITTILGQQFNPIMTTIIILSFVYIHEEKDIWSAFLIMLGTFIKLYGIVGLAFFFFSKHKIKFIGYCFFWSIIFFLLPMLISSPDFVIQSYHDWFNRLVVKNNENVSASLMQDISVMGMGRKISGIKDLSNLIFILPAIFLFVLTYLKLRFYNQIKYRLLLLSSVLIFTVIFSTGAESPTYIIAFVGVAIWFMIKEKRNYWHWFLFIFALILTSFSPTDLVPKFLKEEYIKPYALKALPCFIIWLQIIYELLSLKQEDQLASKNA